MGVLHSFSIKNIFYDKIDLRLFYFHVTNYDQYFTQIETNQLICNINYIMGEKMTTNGQRKLVWNKSLFHFMSLVSFYTLWKLNLWLSDVFRRYRKRPVAWNVLTICSCYKTITVKKSKSQSRKHPEFLRFNLWTKKQVGIRNQ